MQSQPTWDDILTERMRREDEAVTRRFSEQRRNTEDESDNRAWWIKRGSN